MEAPAGFEEILIGSNNANALLLEGINDCTKDLAIISAPGEFDPESLGLVTKILLEEKFCQARIYCTKLCPIRY